MYNLYLKDCKLYKKRPTTDEAVAGTLLGEFSVSATTKVKFSQGNLQYTTTHDVAGGGAAGSDYGAYDLYFDGDAGMYAAEYGRRAYGRAVRLVR